MVGEGTAIPGGRVRSGQADPSAPLVAPFCEPAGQDVSAASFDRVEDQVAVQVDDLGREAGPRSRSGVEGPFLVDPNRLHVLEAVRVVDVGAVYSATAWLAVCHPTPNSAAAAAIESPSTLTISAIRRRDRSVNAALGQISGDFSDQVLTSQSGSGQRRRRFDQHTTVGVPEIGESRTNVVARP